MDPIKIAFEEQINDIKEGYERWRAKRRVRAINLRSDPANFTPEQAPVRKKTARAVGNLLKHRIQTLEEKIYIEEHPGSKLLDEIEQITKNTYSVNNIREYIEVNKWFNVSIKSQLKEHLNLWRYSFSRAVASFLNSSEVYKQQLDQEISKQAEKCFPLSWVIFLRPDYLLLDGVQNIIDSKMSKRREITLNKLMNAPNNWYMTAIPYPIFLEQSKGSVKELEKLRSEQATYLAMMGRPYLEKLSKETKDEKKLSQIELSLKKVEQFEEKFGQNYVHNFMKDLYSMGKESVRSILDFQQANYSVLQVNKNIYVHELFLEMEVFYRAARTFEFTTLKASKLIPLATKQFIYRNLSNKFLSPAKAGYQEALHSMRNLTYGPDWFENWTHSGIPEQAGEFIKKYRAVFPTTFDYWVKQVGMDMEKKGIKSGAALEIS